MNKYRKIISPHAERTLKQGARIDDKCEREKAQSQQKLLFYFRMETNRFVLYRKKKKHDFNAKW